jgi:hypothetical protein
MRRATTPYFRPSRRIEWIRHFTGDAGIDRVVEVNLSAIAGRYGGYLRHDGLAVVYGSDDWATQRPLGAWLVHGIEAIAATRELLADPSFEHRPPPARFL